MIGNFEPVRPDLNLSQDVCNISDYSAIVSIFFCLPTFKFNALAHFLDSTYWLNGIAEKYVFPVHGIVNSEPQHEDTIYSESKQNFRYFARDGKYRFVFQLNCDYQYNQKLRSYSAQNLRIFLADINGNLYGKQVGNTVEPFITDMIQVSKLKFGGAGLISYTDIIVDMANGYDLDYALIDKPLFDVSDLINIECEISDILLDSADTITFSVFAPGEIAINGLIASDFVIIDTITGLKTCVALINTGNGTYSFESNDNFYAGQIKLKNSNYNAFAYYALVTLPQYNPNQYNNTQYNVA